jgi:hypothetical protein
VKPTSAPSLAAQVVAIDKLYPGDVEGGIWLPAKTWAQLLTQARVELTRPVEVSHAG